MSELSSGALIVCCVAFVSTHTHILSQLYETIICAGLVWSDFFFFLFFFLLLFVPFLFVFFLDCVGAGLRFFSASREAPVAAARQTLSAEKCRHCRRGL